ncbi:unnamed protein product, partial [Closterium sp. NIES-53]
GPPHSAAPLVASPCPACRVTLPCLSRRSAACRVALLLAVTSPCWLSRRLAAACRVALPYPRVALLAAAPPCPACASPCPACAEPPCCPHRPAARRPAAARPAGRRPAARAALLRAALLADALLPACRPAGSRTALPCPRAACWLPPCPALAA